MPRVGFGTDLHRLDNGEGIVLGGVSIPCSLRTVAHSDGDVLLHALVDAVLGALGQGDIGELFPDTDPENAGRDSAEFLRAALHRLLLAGYGIGNIDAVVHLQSPKLGANKQAIRQRLAELCELAPEQVNVKAKTGEHLGEVGRGEAIRAEAVVLLRPVS